MAEEIKRVGVVDAGLMGHGIARVAAQTGYEVVLRRLVSAGRLGRRSGMGFYDRSGDAPVPDAGVAR